MLSDLLCGAEATADGHEQICDDQFVGHACSLEPLLDHLDGFLAVERMVRLQLVLLQDTYEGVRMVDVILDDQNLLLRISCVS